MTVLVNASFCYAGDKFRRLMRHHKGKPLTQLDGQLGEGEVHVWLGNPDAVQQSEQERLLARLNKEERERADRFKVESARTQFAVSRGWLRVVLGKYLGVNPEQIDLRFSHHGKPGLASEHGLPFNLSHTQGLTAIAISRLGLVGVDVERVNRERNVLDLAKRFFSAKEAAWVASTSGEEQTPAFLTVWTAKEAYIKAHGEGLSIPLNSFAILPTNDGELQLESFEDPGESRRWSVCALDLSSNFQGALAIECARFEVRIGQLPASGPLH